MSTSLPSTLEELQIYIESEVSRILHNITPNNDIWKVLAESKKSSIDPEQLLDESEKQSKKLQDEVDKFKSDTEIYVFLAYLVGANAPYPPQIPTLWQLDRDLMVKSLYTMVMSIKKKRPELFAGIA